MKMAFHLEAEEPISPNKQNVDSVAYLRRNLNVVLGTGIIQGPVPVPQLLTTKGKQKIHQPGLGLESN